MRIDAVPYRLTKLLIKRALRKRTEATRRTLRCLNEMHELPNDLREQPSSGVRVIAAVFALCGIYLPVLGTLMLIRPGTISMTAGAPLLFGLELAGPYMFLLTGLVAITVAFGLIKLNNIIRHAATLIAIAGIVMLVPPVSAATVMANLKALAVGGLGIIIRVIVAWYLSRAEVAEEFRRIRST
jgi:hypothetical protein